jgi:maltose O-acetyltransferase
VTLHRALGRVVRGVVRDVVLNAVIASPLVPTRGRWLALRAVGMPVERCSVASRVWFGSSRVRIGRGTYVGHHCLFDTWAPITIGERCAIAMQVSFVTSSHELGGPDRRAGAMTTQAVTVGDGAWIGARATVLPGVTIGEGAVVAAGAVVTQDCEPHALYAGVPARRVRALGSEEDERARADAAS